MSSPLVLDPPRFKPDGLKRRAQLMVKASNQIQICHALLDLRRLGRLRELFDQGIGPGIPKEHQTRIFERSYRADPSRSSQTSGSGLGLSICREIVAAHGVQMWLDQQALG